MYEAKANEAAIYIAKCLSGDSLSDSEFERLCHETKIERYALYNQVAMYVAQTYLCGEQDFDFGDNVMNALWVNSEFALPPFARAVFEAFDRGEYRSLDDSPAVDPRETYTRPLLHQTLAKALIGEL